MKSHVFLISALFAFMPISAASGSDVCQGQETPVCKRQFVGSWQGAWADRGNTTVAFNEDATVGLTFQKTGSTDIRTWKIIDPDRIALINPERPDRPFEVEVILTGEVLTLRHRISDSILLPFETSATSKRSKLQPGVWTAGNIIMRGHEEAPLTMQFLKTACANSFVVSRDEGVSEYYYLDHKASGHHHLTYVRQGECHSLGKGRETCTFRREDKADTTESAPQYFSNGDAVLYKDMLHPDWPMQRLHRCPFTVEAVSPFIDGVKSGKWSPALKSWTDLHADITSKNIMGPQDLIFQRVVQFYSVVDPENRKAQ